MAWTENESVESAYRREDIGAEAGKATFEIPSP